MAKIKAVEDHEHRYQFYCPACDLMHTFPSYGPVQSGEGEPLGWGFDGNFAQPTVDPSINIVKWDETMGGGEKFGEDGKMYYRVCHSVITNGNIYFAQDSTHPLAGQMIELPNIE